MEESIYGYTPVLLWGRIPTLYLEEHIPVDDQRQNPLDQQATVPNNEVETPLQATGTQQSSSPPYDPTAPPVIDSSTEIPTSSSVEYTHVSTDTPESLNEEISIRAPTSFSGPSDGNTPDANMPPKERKANNEPEGELSSSEDLPTNEQNATGDKAIGQLSKSIDRLTSSLVKGNQQRGMVVATLHRIQSSLETIASNSASIGSGGSASSSSSSAGGVTLRGNGNRPRYEAARDRERERDGRRDRSPADRGGLSEDQKKLLDDLMRISRRRD